MGLTNGSGFFWGSGGEKLTPEQLAGRRKVADALRQREGYVPAGWMSLLGGLAGEGVASYKNAEIDKQESEAQKRVADALMQARGGSDPNAYLDVMGDPFATPQQQAVASARYQQSQPDWQTIESGNGDILRWNQNDPNAEAQVFYDAPEAAPDLTDDQREYNFAVENGFEGAFSDWMGKGKPDAISANIGANGIDYGDPGPGLGYERDQAGQIRLDERSLPILVPLQGGEAWNEADAAAEAQAVTDMRQGQKTDVVLQDINRALVQIAANPGWTAGVGAQATGWLGGTPAANVNSLVNSIRANVGFDQLQAMREASPTGGALGPVSDTENRLLQSVLGDLSQSQEAQQLADNLIRLENTILDVVHGPGNGPPRKVASFERINAPRITDDAAGKAAFDRLPRGAVFIDPEGKTRRKP